MQSMMDALKLGGLSMDYTQCPLQIIANKTVK